MKTNYPGLCQFDGPPGALSTRIPSRLPLARLIIAARMTSRESRLSELFIGLQAILMSPDYGGVGVESLKKKPNQAACLQTASGVNHFQRPAAHELDSQPPKNQTLDSFPLPAPSSTPHSDLIPPSSLLTPFASRLLTIQETTT
ncbi:hypothetical protein PGTUg99_007168 [Puccinia graminis f. sp. tritici]|uniref:Uncharacterized protein n=1 Tax=Puccinia graminis f. sp. tritici TaxID=56615 RepID=A0A5B0RZ27_PUCGR|nr:hypothetical protein PGTUg99_007168 [Puccinia graminis f. sp. tritici]